MSDSNLEVSKANEASEMSRANAVSEMSELNDLTVKPGPKDVTKFRLMRLIK